MEKENVILVKSFDFALKIIKLYKEMSQQHEYVISRQILKSGTSIGANAEEANAAISKKEFIAKMSISAKECRESRYWLRLIRYSKIVDINVDELLQDVEELNRILSSIIKTSQGR